MINVRLFDKNRIEKWKTCGDVIDVVYNGGFEKGDKIVIDIKNIQYILAQGLFNGVEVRLDPSRVASTIASGIGFLGADMIFVQKSNIIGLTTAAGIWATSGVGMAIGAGMYSVGIASTIIIIVAQVVLHLEGKRNKLIKTKIILIKDVASSDYQEYMTSVFNDIGVKVIDVTVDKVEDLRNYIYRLEYPSSVNEDKIVSLIDYDCSMKA